MQLRWLLFYLFIIGNSNIHGLLHSKKPVVLNTTETRAQANVKIFSNMAEVLINFGKLPIEFSAEDWSDIRSDSITLVGSNVTIKQQTITEKQKSLDNTDIYIRSPASTASKTEFIKATMIDEKQNIVKITDKDIAKEPVYHRIQSGDIFYTDHPPETKHYINFDYDATGEVFLSYIRSNLKWNTRYQLNLFEETKTPVLIAMADIHNNGHSKVDIQHAELIAGDINLSSSGGGYGYAYPGLSGPQMAYMSPASARYDAAPPPSPKLSRGEELSGLYVFSINQPFTIEGRTNYLLPMFRPRITVDRFSSISKTFYGAVASSSGKAQRSYRLKSEQFLSRGTCLVRELDRLAGETSIPNLAAKDKHEFSLGEDVDVTYKENSTLISSRNDTNRPSSMISSRDRDNVARTVSTYEIQVAVRNFRKSRGVNVEYNQQIYGHAVKLYTPNTHFSQDGSTIKAVMTIPADDEKIFSYKVEITN